MKTLLTLTSLLATLTARAGPVYHITETDSGLSTDIPDATVTLTASPTTWEVSVPAGQSFIGPPMVFLDAPDPARVDLVGLGLGWSTLSWRGSMGQEEYDNPQASETIFLYADTPTELDPLASIVLSDQRVPVGEAGSTALLMGLVLAGVVGMKKGRPA